MQTFEIEREGKTVKLNLRDPDLGQRNDFLDVMAAMQAKNTEMRKKHADGSEFSEEETRTLIKLMHDLENQIFKGIVECCTDGSLKTADDFKKISGRSVGELRTWFLKTAGVNVGESLANFMKP